MAKKFKFILIIGVMLQGSYTINNSPGTHR